ncbi:hypothetical protein [Desulforamulus aquiferis]|uniref:Uncharacterized protein n=1 Tax=Desulforamulus aquiferis TaxID=1397668 RepID=A0AAW7ZD78_9FIRM|nr:hypothetical protein [Desulforamulus aquiferis]MDO7787109.1 hypothetical protein [Desulforamulus aquiferis]
MPPDEVGVIVQWLKRIEDVMNKQREENREDIKRIHERLDLQRNAVTHQECEKYRGKCCELHDKKIQAAKGYPTWVVVLFSICSGLIVYVVTKGGG